ncbi:caspase family protein [Mangrovivirga cuniculi]|nr:caspase family protein [Mangrovivirga cuniculi]
MGKLKQNETYCFLVGVEKYNESCFPNLPAAASNVFDLRKILIKHGFSPDKIDIEINPYNKDDLRIKLTKILESKNTKNLLFYFSGHGACDSYENFALVLSNTLYTDDEFKHTGLLVPFLNDLFGRRLKDLNLIFILDCCFSDRVVEDLTMHNQYVIVSSASDSKSIYPVGEENSIFTREFLNVLENGIPGGEKYLTLDDIYDFIDQKLNSQQPRRQRRGEIGNKEFIRNIAFNANKKSKQTIADEDNLNFIFEELIKVNPNYTGFRSFSERKIKILESFPFFISYHLKNLLPKSDIIKGHYLKHFYLIIKELLCFSFLSQYLQVKNIKSTGLINQILDSQNRDYVKIIDIITNYLNRVPNELVFNESNRWSDSLRKLFIKMDSLLEENDLEEQKFYDLLINLIGYLSFLTEYSYISVRLIDVIYRKYESQPYYYHEGSLLHGERLEPYRESIKNIRLIWEKPRNSNSILLFKNKEFGTDKYINLWPFFVDCQAFAVRDGAISNPDPRIFVKKENGSYWYKSLNFATDSNLKAFKELDSFSSFNNREKLFEMFEKNLL